MPRSLTTRLIEEHLADGELVPGSEIALRIDQTLTQDATGTLVMLELERLGLDRVRTEVSAQYVDHNLLQVDHKNADDHRFLESACRRWGIWWARPGSGVSHPVHQERFGAPGKTLLGADSHTPAAGAVGMLAIGAGGIDVAQAMAGEPYRLPMPEVFGVELTGELPDWVSAKDVVLELLRRHGVEGAAGCVLEYHGPGLAALGVMDRHVLANMGTELGATSTVFPSDETTRRFLAAHGREDDWRELAAEDGAGYDRTETVELGELEPLIAMPSSPGNVRPVAEVAGEPIYQAYVGSSANPGYRDFAVAARIVAGRKVDPRVSFDVNPTSRRLLLDLVRDGHLAALLAAGARLHQTGCNGCIGMGQAPASGQISLRTVPRNFPGRSGTADDEVCLVSPETAAASALRGEITDPRTLEVPYPRIEEPEQPARVEEPLRPPLPPDEAAEVELVRGPNIEPLPELDELPDALELVVALRVGDDVSTDEILPAGARVLPFRSNIPKIAEFCFDGVDPGYPERARKARDSGGHAIVAGRNYGQGSSREHAALAPRHLGLRLVVARGFARIHHQNLINFGVLPLLLEDEDDNEAIELGDELRLADLRAQLVSSQAIEIENRTRDCSVTAHHQLSPRQVEMLVAGGVLNLLRERLALGAI